MTRYHNTSSGDVAFTAEEETAWDAQELEWANEQADYLANHKYKDDRKAAYGPMADQLDMIYHDRADGTSTFKDHIAAVKAAHPKPGA